MATSPSSGDPGEPPLSIEPVLGWRVWRLGRGADGFVLRSVTRDDAWPAGETMTARCGTHRGATVPAQACRCGLYAADSPEDLARSGIFGNGACVIGAVAMWGRVVEHARGARSRSAYPARLRLVCAPCLAAGEGAVEPAVVVPSGNTLMALCGRHGDPGAGATPAAQVQAELLAAYGVELVPMERIARKVRAGGPVAPVLRWTRPLHAPILGLLTIVRMLLGGLFMLWAFSGMIFLVGAIVVGTLQGVAQALGLWAPGPTPSAVAPTPVLLPPLPSTAIREVVPSEVVPPYAVSHPVPMNRRSSWSVAAVCGRGDRGSVTVAPCDARSDLLGIAERGTPSGVADDCASRPDVYSRGAHYWICWIDLRSPSPVHRWADAPSPWSIPEQRGGASDGDR